MTIVSSVQAAPLSLVLAAGLTGVIGGFVRGYSGFGFALTAVPALNLVVPPIVSIPAVLIVEFSLGLTTVAPHVTNVDRRAMTWLVTGTLCGTPVGLYALSNVPPDLARLVIGILVVVAAYLTRVPASAMRALGRIPLFLVGLLSGFLNGGTAMSGPPVVVTLLRSPLSVPVVRATMIAFITFSAGFGSLLALSRGLFDPERLVLALFLLPAAAIGGVLGVLCFRRTPTSVYRPASIAILVLVSLGAIASAGYSLFRH
jgi:uncharacterized membrane protein YfcA